MSERDASVYPHVGHWTFTDRRFYSRLTVKHHLVTYYARRRSSLSPLTHCLSAHLLRSAEALLPIISSSAAKLCLILTFALGLAAVGSWSPQAAHAVEPNLMMSAPQADRGPGGVSQSDEIDVAALRERRKQAQTDLNPLRGSLAPKSVTGAAGEEPQERQALLEQIVRGYDEQLSDVQRLAEARQRHADIVRGNSEWKGLSEPSPYSIFLADQLWDTCAFPQPCR